MNTLSNLWPLGVLLFLINCFSFFLMGRDKYLARKKRWRTPEKWFFTLGFLGGALGVLLGMNVFRHKTKHNSFVFGVPLLLVWNLYIIYELSKYFS